MSNDEATYDDSSGEGVIFHESMSPDILRNVVSPKACAEDERHCLHPKDAKPVDGGGNWKAQAVVINAIAVCP